MATGNFRDFQPVARRIENGMVTGTFRDLYPAESPKRTRRITVNSATIVFLAAGLKCLVRRHLYSFGRVTPFWPIYLPARSA
jgi:hypothetical protein